MRPISSKPQGVYGASGNLAGTATRRRLDDFLNAHASQGITQQADWVELVRLLERAVATSRSSGEPPLTETQVKSLATALERSTFHVPDDLLKAGVRQIVDGMCGGHPNDLQRISDVLAPVVTDVSMRMGQSPADSLCYLHCFVLGHSCKALNDAIAVNFKCPCPGLFSLAEELATLNLPDHTLSSLFQDLSSRLLKYTEPKRDSRHNRAMSSEAAQHSSDVSLARLAWRLRDHVHLEETRLLLTAFAQALFPISNRLIGAGDLRNPTTFDQWLRDCTHRYQCADDMDLHQCDHAFAGHVVTWHLRDLQSKPGAHSTKILTGNANAMKQVVIQAAAAASPNWKFEIRGPGIVLKWEPANVPREKKRKWDVAPTGLESSQPRPWTGTGSGVQITATTTTADDDNLALNKPLEEQSAQSVADQPLTTVAHSTMPASAGQGTGNPGNVASQQQPTPWRLDPDAIVDDLVDGEVPPAVN